jgi:hypothetical protein
MSSLGRAKKVARRALRRWAHSPEEDMEPRVVHSGSYLLRVAKDGVLVKYGRVRKVGTGKPRIWMTRRSVGKLARRFGIWGDGA